MAGQYVDVVKPKEHHSMPNESNEESKDGRIRVTLHPSIVKNIKQKLPEHQRDRPLAFIIDDLLADRIKTTVDSSAIISGPPGRYSYSSSFEELEKESLREKGRETFITPPSEYFTCHEKYQNDCGLENHERWLKAEAEEQAEKHKAFLEEQKKVGQKLPTAFLQFWETFNTAPRKANQSRKKAFEAWKEALKVEKSDRLIEAARRAVLDQTNKMQQEEWFEPLPDCYRWLRDEKFVVLLEAHVPAKAKQIIPGVTCL